MTNTTTPPTSTNPPTPFDDAYWDNTPQVEDCEDFFNCWACEDAGENLRTAEPCPYCN